MNTDKRTIIDTRLDDNNMIINTYIESLNDSLKKNEFYDWRGNKVPRVTKIISEMIHNDYLLNWSNSLGWKRKGYRAEVQISADIGTITHKNIELYLKGLSTKFIPDEEKSYEINLKAETAFNSFLLYYNMLIKNGHKVEILYSEMELICPYFAGTCDAILRIDGKIYVYDWKTSNHLSYNYILQLSAYCYILSNYYWIDINGICIVRFDKNKIDYEELLLRFDIPEQLDYIYRAFEFFYTLVSGYYQRKYFENNFPPKF